MAFLRGEARRDGRGNLPQGVVQTTLGLTGDFNGAAEAFKKDAVKNVIAKGFKPVFGFGNRPSDVARATAVFPSPSTSRTRHACALR